MRQPPAWIIRTPLLLTVALSLLLSAGVQAANAPAPKFMAVLMYADWCESCKILDPKIQEIRSEFDQSDILFLRFDLTDEGTSYQSSMLAHTLGLAELYAQNRGRTGYMVLVDRATGKVSTIITKEHSEAEIQHMLREAAGT